MTTRRSTLRSLAAGAVAAAGAVVGRSVFAQDDKSAMTILIGIGASMDLVGRLIAEQLHDTLGRPVVVLSKLGAGQRIALGEARRSAPDGRTLLFSTNGPFSIYPNIYNKLDYDPVADFTPICGISSFDVAIAVGPQSDITSLRQYIDWARSRPAGDVVYGSAPGTGSLSHFAGISLAMATGIPMTHVPYKESGTGTIDLSGGRLPMMITGLNAFVELHRAGKVRILAVSGEARSPLVPEVPTFKESGVNLSSSTTTGVFGPPRMSPELVRRLHDAIVPMLSKPAVQEKIEGQSMVVWQATPQQLAANLAQERQRFEALVKASGYVREDA
jgi:tripartite-type tricarboxylate transporter receptor subunit TctC